MGKFVETFRGVVYPWHCDQLGHMNVQHYVGMFDQGGFHLFAAGKVRMGNMNDTGRSFADVKHVIEYKAEQRVGSLVVIEGCVRRVGTKSMTTFQRMTNIETGDVAATSEVTSVYFDLNERKSLIIPDELRKNLGPILVEED